MPGYDPRLNAFRPDLADERLRGRLNADRFVAGEPYSVSAGCLSLRENPSADARQGSELLFGESVNVFETKDGWAWLQNETDGYVGYAAADGLSPGHRAATHCVGALRTYLYLAPDLKAPTRDLISMNSRLAVERQESGFLGLADGGWAWAGHAVPTGDFETDHAAVAMRFLGAPYLWGGRSSLGLDCSALAQLALERCGVQAPRDTDMQAALVGTVVPFDGDEAALRRGDLVFWPGHVGIWLDSQTFVHANATHMMTTAEPFAKVARHIREATGDVVSTVRRP